MDTTGDEFNLFANMANTNESVDDLLTGEDELLAERTAIFNQIKRWHRLVTSLAHDETITRGNVNTLAKRIIDIEELLSNPGKTSTAIFVKIKDINKQLLEDEKQVEQLAIQRSASSISAQSSSIPQPMTLNVSSLDPHVSITPWNGTALGYYRFAKQFTSFYIHDSSYTDVKRINAFRRLVGERGRRVIGDIDDDREGLETAMKRMSDYFCKDHHIRGEVERQITSYPMIRSERDAAGLKQFLSISENAYKALKFAKTSREYLSDTFYNNLRRKLPWTMIDKLLSTDGDVRDVKLLLDRIREQISRSEIVNESLRDPAIAPPRARIHHVASGQFPVHPNALDSPASPSYRFSDHPTGSTFRLNNPRTVPPSNRNPQPNRGSLVSRCKLCDQTGHHVFQCTYGTATDRNQLASRKQLCTRCLCLHPPSCCRSSYFCTCGEPHSRVLCPNNGVRPTGQVSSTGNATGRTRRPPQQQTATPAPNAASGTNTTINMAMPFSGSHLVSDQSQQKKYARPELLTTYLQTIVVSINGVRARVLLDNSAGRTLVHENLVNRLKLPDYAQHTLHLGAFDGTSIQTSRRLVKATLQSLTSRRSKELIMCVTSSLDTRPPVVPLEIWNDLKDRGYELADSLENDHQPVSIIIGAEYFRSLFTGNDIDYNNELSLRHSIFGWTIHGVTEDSEEEYQRRVSNPHHPRRPPFIGFIKCTGRENCHHVTTGELVETASQLSTTGKPMGNNLDFSTSLHPNTVATYNRNDKLEVQYLNDFVKTHVHYDGKRYSVNLPWILPIDLEDNKTVALTRYHRLRRTLSTNGMTAQYDQAMNEMVRDYTEPVNEHCDSPKCYYLPHHPVLRLDKETTKVRPVFDGSSHSSTGRPLNDFLYKGVLSWDLLRVLLQFRFGEYAITADIEKAFLRIQVEPEERDAFRFWWKDERGHTVVRRFKAVPFGTSASPFLLYAVLYHLFSTNRADYPDVVPLIEKRMYVDDIVAAFRDATAAQLDKFRTRSIEMFRKADMNLRKFRTNHHQLDKDWNGADAKNVVHGLGQAWNVITDTLSPWIDITSFQSVTSLTKRQFTSFVQSVYNPTGTVAPFVLKLKFALQSLWKMKLNWDELIPESEFKLAKELIKDAQLVNQMTSPRNVLPTDGSLPSLRLYCDASKHAIGVVAYCCSSLGNLLLMAKTRLAREATIPELELDALVLAAEVSNFLTGVDSFSSITICGDSKLNLQRLIKHPNKQTPSVALRVRAINKLAPTATFRHVESKQNIADVASRGTSMTALLANQSWLRAPELPEQTQFEAQITSIISTVNAATGQCSCTLFPNYGMAINTYLHVARFLQRFGKQARYKDIHELELALVLLIRTVQRNHFPTEIEALESNNPIDRCSILNNHVTYLDTLGQLRLYTRLKESRNFSLDEVHPILLPNHCHFTQLVIAHVHTMTLHPGVDRTCSSIRERYFILNQRKLVKKYVNNCNICKLKRSQPVQLSHGQLPSFRTDIFQPPFYNTGIDLFGPLKVLMTTPGKRYGIIFACATSRMVHIELVSDMTAESVFQAITKFVARRGLPHLFYSDNGKQFLKVKDDLKSYIDTVNRQHPERELRFNWIHLTAHSPWRGGFYERLIRGIKDSLITLALDRKMNSKRLDKERKGLKKPPIVTRGGKAITDKQLETYMVEIEALINNRPLFAHEDHVIKPTDFLGAQGSSQLPIVGNLPSDYRKPNIIRDYRTAQRRINTVRQLWRDNYFLRLRELHQTQLGKHDNRKYSVGDVVHVKKPSVPLDQWPLGIVTGVFVSKDGVIRSVTLRTLSQGNITTEVKDVHNLIPVECNHERHELELDANSTNAKAHVVQTRSTNRPTTTIIAVKRPRSRKAPIDLMLKSWRLNAITQHKDAAHRQSLRDRISSALSNGTPKTSKQIKAWLKELYSISSDAHCRSLATSFPAPPTGC